MPESEILSTCCDEPVRIEGDDDEGTHYYVCSGCGEGCGGTSERSAA